MEPHLQLYPGQQVLTPAQEAEARRFFAERFQAQLSTEPVDEPETEALLQRFYQQVAHLPPLAHIEWLDNPLQLVTWLASPSSQVSLGESIRRRIDAGYKDSFGAKSVSSIYNSLRTTHTHWEWENHPEERLRCSIIQSLFAYLRATVQEQHWDPIVDSVQAHRHVVWLVLYHFCAIYLEPNATTDQALFNERVSGYWLGTQGALLVRRPRLIMSDAESRLHSATSHAIEYPDGWGLYVWHGVLVPEKVILAPERLSREDFFQEANVEVRRIIQERMGGRFVSDLGGQVIDQGPHGTLYEVRLPADDPERVARYIQVQDASTARQYFLRVPPTIQTANEAVAWSFQLAVEAYHPAQET